MCSTFTLDLNLCTSWWICAKLLRWRVRIRPLQSRRGQVEEVRRRFSIVGAYSLGSFAKKPQDCNDSLYRVNKTKQHTYQTNIHIGLNDGAKDRR